MPGHRRRTGRHSIQHRSPARRGAAAALAASLLLLAGCATTEDGLRVGGRVEDRTDTVSAPALLAVAPDPNAGFTPTAGTPQAPTPIAAVLVTDAAPLGTRVKRGDAVAHVDSAVQDAALAAAQADAELAARRVDLLDSSAADVRDQRKDLRAKRRDLVTAIDTLTTTRPDLVKTRADLLAQQVQLNATLPTLAAQRVEVAQGVATLTASRDQLRATIATLCAQRGTLAAAPDSPEKVAGLAQLDAALAQARAGLLQVTTAYEQAAAGLAQLDAGIATATAGAQQLAAGLVQVTQGIGTVDANLTTARTGLGTIDDGLDQLADAESALVDAAELARVTSRASIVGLGRAEQQQSLTTLVAPADGVVVRTSLPGDVVAPGAPVVVVRPDAAASVTAWVAPDAAARLCVGDGATVATDWGTTHRATVARVGVRAEYPPTAQATDEIHLTRAVAVTVTLDTDALPPGAPVDLTLTACRKEN